MKVDFEKAYDCIEWDFILDCLESTGFGNYFIRMVYTLLVGAITRVQVNGERKSSTDENTLRMYAFSI